MRIGDNTAINGLAGIEMDMSATVKVKMVIIQDTPQVRIGNIRRGPPFVIRGDDIVIGSVIENKFMGGFGPGHLVCQPI